jgi:sulfatase modifying factor 1
VLSVAALATVVGSGLLACSSCSETHHQVVDAATDTDTDADSDSDTLDFDGGPLVPCENEPGDDEICISGSSFPMGCVPQDTECFDKEKPLHVVTLSPFFIDRHEATWNEVIPWLNTLREGYVRNPYFVSTEDGKIGWGNGEKISVALNADGDYALCPDTIDCDEVNWPGMYAADDWAAAGFSRYGAQLYCEAQGKQLPTEAQWEYAARGPTYNRFPGTDVDWGCNLGFIALCPGMSCDVGGWEWCIPQTTEFGVVSPFGVYNMAGGAAEWVADLAYTVDDNYDWCADGCADPAPLGGLHAISRGGGSCSTLPNARVSARAIYAEIDSGGTLNILCAGVRCVRPDAPLVLPDGGTDGGK